MSKRLVIVAFGPDKRLFDRYNTRQDRQSTRQNIPDKDEVKKEAIGFLGEVG